MRSRLEIELEADAVPAGAPLRGAVLVEALRDCHSEGVWLELGWRTEGRGSEERGAPLHLELQPMMRWRRGETFRLAFALDAPVAPVTYRGKTFRVFWTLTAGTDVRLALQPPVSREVTILPSLAADAWVEPGELGDAERLRANRLQCGVAGAALFAVALVTVLGSGGLGVFSTLALLVGAGAAAWGLRNRAAELRLGEVELEVGDRVVAGEAVEVKLAFSPPQDLELRGVRAVLVGTEVARTSGNDPRTETHELAQIPVTLMGAGLVRGGQRTQLRGALPVPPRAAPSFKGHHHEVKWRVELRIDIPGWPDWVLDVGVVVLPSPSGAITVRMRPPTQVAIQPRQRCPYCRDALARQQHLATCAGCQTVYHADCYAELGRCATRGCRLGRNKWRA